MKTEHLQLHTKDASLRDELLTILPEGVTISDLGSAQDGGIIVFDLDTMKPAAIRDLSATNTVIAVTQRKNTEAVMEATTFGAYETVPRPLRSERLIPVLEEVQQLRQEIAHPIPVTASSLAPTCAIVGHSPVILDVCKKLARLSQVEAPVLITGETGTGKELIAESIAQLSSRFGKPFVVVNCAAVPETLLEAELFGFEKGSFTGAISAKEGILRIADEGCVFLDEVGELPLSLQSKLLRFLQTQTFYPLGSIKEVQVNVRVISATNRDLSTMVKEGNFREDLYHRLRVTTIHVPPLRDRKQDMLPLIHFFVNRYRNTAPLPIKGITRAFLKKMQSYDWPGNIRELENAIRSAIALSKTHYLTTLELRELGTLSLSQERGETPGSFWSALIPHIRSAIDRKETHIYEKIHQEVDRHLFEYVLTYTRENQSEAARILGISRLTLRKKLH